MRTLLALALVLPVFQPAVARPRPQSAMTLTYDEHLSKVVLVNGFDGPERAPIRKQMRTNPASAILRY